MRVACLLLPLLVTKLVFTSHMILFQLSCLSQSIGFHEVFVGGIDGKGMIIYKTKNKNMETYILDIQFHIFHTSRSCSVKRYQKFPIQQRPLTKYVDKKSNNIFMESAVINLKKLSIYAFRELLFTS